MRGKSHEMINLYSHLLLAFTRIVCKCSIAVAATTLLVNQSAADGGTDSFYFSPTSGKYAFRVESVTNNNLRSMAIQVDGKIVLAGGCNDVTTVARFCVARLTAAGALDPTFVGPSGVTSAFLLPIGTNGAPASESVDQVKIQTDGKILIGGTCRVGAERRICLARLLESGAYDVSFGDYFGSGGRIILPPMGNDATGYDSLAGLDVLPDGRIVISGDCAASSSAASSTCVAVNSADARSRTKAIYAKLGSGSSSAQVIDIDNRIISFYSCNMGATGVDFCATRVLPSTMALDAGFDGGDNISTGNGNGRISMAITNAADYLTAAASAPAVGLAGFVLLAGSCLNGTRYEFCAHRIDQSQGRSVLFLGTSFPSVVASMSSGSNFATSIASYPDGRFVIVGQCDQGGRNYFCAARFRADGTLDVTFDGDANVNGNGKFLLPSILDDDRATAVAIQTRADTSRSDGFLVLAGTCTLGSATYFCVTRLTSYSDAARCDLDLDGDGQYLATVDGLILTRIMLGIKDAAFMNGITPSPNARRTTHATIRRYLVQQCGFDLP
jgi:uncharacterized delta-60 repeat protein